MVERNRRDDGQRRLWNDVGRVEPAAEANFKQKHVGRCLGEGEKGRCRRDLELCDVVAVVHRLRAHQHVDERVFVDGARLAVGPASSMRSWKRTRCGEV